MTVVPFLHREEDIYEVASLIKGAKKFFIQEFRPDSTLSPAYSRIRPFSPDKIAKIRAHVAGIMADDDGIAEAPIRRYGIVNKKADRMAHNQVQK
jgi:hypothetical protein